MTKKYSTAPQHSDLSKSVMLSLAHQIGFRIWVVGPPIKI